MPITIHGPWKKGISLDFHIVSSEFLGKDEFGRKQFKTIRTEIGEYVYHLKYNDDLSVVQKIIEKINEGIKDIHKYDFIVAVPPSNTDRAHQPVILIAKSLSEAYSITFAEGGIIKKKSTKQLKDIHDIDEKKKELAKVFKVSNSYNFKNKKILLIDDLYETGTTLSAVTDCLIKTGLTKEVDVITLTKTKG